MLSVQLRHCWHLAIAVAVLNTGIQAFGQEGIVIEGELAKGQHVLEYAVDAFSQGKWTVAANGESIGRKRIHLFDPPIHGAEVRLRIIRANAIPTIRAFSCYGEYQ